MSGEIGMRQNMFYLIPLLIFPLLGGSAIPSMAVTWQDAECRIFTANAPIALMNTQTCTHESGCFQDAANPVINPVSGQISGDFTLITWEYGTSVPYYRIDRMSGAVWYTYFWNGVGWAFAGNRYNTSFMRTDTVENVRSQVSVNGYDGYWFAGNDHLPAGCTALGPYCGSDFESEAQVACGGVDNVAAIDFDQCTYTCYSAVPLDMEQGIDDKESCQKNNDSPNKTPQYLGNPINILNGNKYETATDLVLPTPNRQQIGFRRSYNSQSIIDELVKTQ